jgi:hypothetical protein
MMHSLRIKPFSLALAHSPLLTPPPATADPGPSMAAAAPAEPPLEPIGEEELVVLLHQAPKQLDEAILGSALVAIASVAIGGLLLLALRG